jgi:hypothetical protein
MTKGHETEDRKRSQRSRPGDDPKTERHRTTNKPKRHSKRPSTGRTQNRNRAARKIEN